MPKCSWGRKNGGVCEKRRDNRHFSNTKSSHIKIVNTLTSFGWSVAQSIKNRKISDRLAEKTENYPHFNGIVLP